MTRLRFLLPLLGLFLLTRLAHLEALPIFLDETVHLRWAFNVSQGDKIFRPWADGRLLTIWLYALVLPHVSHILAVARALSGLAGAVTLIGIVAIGERLRSAPCGLVAGLLYVLCPFTLFYDRLALTDSFVSAGATLTLLLSLGLVERPSLARGALLGVLLSACVLVKFSAILLFLVPAASALLLSPGARVPRGLALAYALAFFILAYPLFVFAQTDMLKLVAVQAREEGLWTDTLGNLALAWQYLTYYWGPGLLALGGAGALLSVRRAEGRLLLALTLLPLAIVALSLRVWFARYILWETVPFVLLGGLAVTALWEGRTRPVALALLLLAVLPVLRRDVLLIRDPPRAGLPPSEDAQYVNGWPSGYGVRETVAFFQQALASHPEGLTVVTHSASHRTLWNALDLYFQDEPSFDLEAMDLSAADAVPWLAQGGFSRARPTYVVLSPRSEGGHKTTVSREALEGTGRRVGIFRKPDGTVASEIYLLAGDGASGRR